ncbi:MAG: autotransporter domain-containing protein [Xanthobacteraceae bacterium]|jgi:autotransporter-associated beta strand protein
MGNRSALPGLNCWLISVAAQSIACLLLLSWIDVSAAQTFVSEGPAPRFGPAYAVQSADASPNGTEAGAIQAILPDPALGAQTMFAGSPNGGIWVTYNNGASWTPLTDKQASLSIASLALDPTDPTGKTIIAGVGITDNGEYSHFNLAEPLGRGGAQTGILYSTNAGATWSALGGTTLEGQSVIGVEARGSTILAATFEEQAATGSTAGYGLYRSTNGGATFSLVSGGSGLPTGAVTSLVADPSNPSRFYAAVKLSGNNAATSVYVSNNTGATWTPIFTAANSNGTITSGAQTAITLAAGPSGSVAVAVSNLESQRALAGVFLSTNVGATWNQLTAAPDVVPGHQTPVNLHVAIDPTNANVVYLTGDAYQNCGGASATSVCSIQAYRVVYNPNNNSSTATSLTNEGTAAQNFLNANTAHADSRAMAFDASGNLILSGDGGVYLRTNPQGNGTWENLNNNLSVFEPYGVAYDANSKRLAIAAQDAGVSLQSAPGSTLFNAINLGDGVNIAINDKKLSGLSAIYSTIYNLGAASRMIVNAQGQVVSPFPDPVNNPGGVPITCNGGQDCTEVTHANNTFSAPLVLNKIDPTRIAIGGSTDVYVTQDSLSGPNGVNATSVDLHLTDLGTTAGPSVITYGTVANTQAIAVGAGPGGAGGQVWFSANNTAGSLTRLTDYAGYTPTSIVFDTRIQSRIFVADSANLYYTRNADGAATFTTLTSNFPAGFTRPTSTEFVSSNDVNAILVGGLNTPLTCTSAPNGCMISSQQSPITVADSDANGNLSGWRAFGQGLPNALVDQMAYNPTVDVLSVASVGRGVWLLYDVTSNFTQATVLQFGLANNNSNPDPSLLTDGTVGSRPLIKYGTGTLTITGDATYSGSTTVNGGTLEVDGTISNTSSVAVNSTGILTGVGTVDPVVVSINSGGTFAPGAAGVPGTSMTIVGNLAFQSGAFYLVQLNSTTSTFANVTGTASLGGTVLAAFAPGTTSLAHQYTILQSTGLNGTTFASLATSNLPTNFSAGLGYTADDVLLDISATLGAGAGLNGNQQNVANALNDFFNGGGALPPNFLNVFGMTGASLGSALTQLDGEAATGAEHAAFQMMDEFLLLMLDPFVDGRGSGGPNGQAIGFAPEEAANLPPDVAFAYASILNKAPPKPTFDQRWTAWGAAYGGSSTTNGDPTVGSSNLTASTYGFAGGMDYHVTPNTVFGFALAGGGTSWGLSTGNGRSDAFQVGVYGIRRAGPAYLSGALAFTNHWFTTNHAVLGDQLTANFDGQSYGARLEGGYRYAVLPTLGVTPYAALQAQDFHTPGYSETDLNGGGFGLSYAAMNATDVRTELGTRLDHPTLVAGMPLILRARVAWAHDFVSNPSLGAVFQSLPGSNFIVNGAPIPQNSALTSAGAELFLASNWSLIAKFDGEFAPGSQTYAGSGTLRYAW